jgi:uncharacterized membrane protein
VPALTIVKDELAFGHILCSKLLSGWVKVIDDIELARALHVLSVTHWVGGVAFMTLVALPVARTSSDPREGWALFERFEARFAAQVKWSILLAGVSGFWMTGRLGLWGAFADPNFWWMGAMAALWALFMLIVFVVEPITHRRIVAQALRDPLAILGRLYKVHLALLVAAAVTIVGAVTGSNGGLFR